MGSALLPEHKTGTSPDNQLTKDITISGHGYGAELEYYQVRYVPTRHQGTYPAPIGTVPATLKGHKFREGFRGRQSADGMQECG